MLLPFCLRLLLLGGRGRVLGRPTCGGGRRAGRRGGGRERESSVGVLTEVGDEGVKEENEVDLRRSNEKKKRREESDREDERTNEALSNDATN